MDYRCLEFSTPGLIHPAPTNHFSALELTHHRVWFSSTSSERQYSLRLKGKWTLRLKSDILETQLLVLLEEVLKHTSISRLKISQIIN